jgi:hypothetical protein
MRISCLDDEHDRFLWLPLAKALPKVPATDGCYGPRERGGLDRAAVRWFLVVAASGAQSRPAEMPYANAPCHRGISRMIRSAHSTAGAVLAACCLAARSSSRDATQPPIDHSG